MSAHVFTGFYRTRKEFKDKETPSLHYDTLHFTEGKWLQTQTETKASFRPTCLFWSDFLVICVPTDLDTYLEVVTELTLSHFIFWRLSFFQGVEG